MSSRLPNWKSLFLTILVLGALPSAWAQSAETGQQILFSTPEGEVVSNSAAPAIQSPDSQGLASLPDEAPAPFFKVQSFPQTVLFTPGPVPRQSMQNSGDQDPLDPMGQQKIMAMLTPAEIMGAPTVQQILGLPAPSAAKFLKIPALMGNAGASHIGPAGGTSSEDPSWTKFLAENAAGNGFGAAKGGQSQGLLGGFLNGAPAGDVFDNQDNNAAANTFGSASADETAAGSGSSPLDSSLAGKSLVNSSLNSSTPDAAVNSGFNSPFALPQGNRMDALPHLPTLPSPPGQNYSAHAPSVPSWEPKPAPWLSPVPQPGVMQPRKF